MATIADFWFDPLCPWAWITSRWMLEVEKVRDVTVRWHVMSLGHPEQRPRPVPEYSELMRQAKGPVRVCIAAEQAHGPEVLGPLYTALGNRFHLEKLPKDRATIEAALVEAGSADRARRRDGRPVATTRRSQRSHHEGMDPVGDGCRHADHPLSTASRSSARSSRPTRAARRPAGCGTASCSSRASPGFYELKRSRDPARSSTECRDDHHHRHITPPRRRSTSC